MSNFDGVYPVDIVDEIKSEEGGVYKRPKQGVQSKYCCFNEPVQVVGYDQRILNNFVDPNSMQCNEQDNFGTELVADFDEEDTDEQPNDGEVYLESVDVIEIQSNGAVSFCTIDQLDFE